MPANDSEHISAQEEASGFISKMKVDLEIRVQKAREEGLQN
jgi:hypothetical protein